MIEPLEGRRLLSTTPAAAGWDVYSGVHGLPGVTVGIDGNRREGGYSLDNASVTFNIGGLPPHQMVYVGIEFFEEPTTAPPTAQNRELVTTSYLNVVRRESPRPSGSTGPDPVAQGPSDWAADDSGNLTVTIAGSGMEPGAYRYDLYSLSIGTYTPTVSLEVDRNTLREGSYETATFKVKRDLPGGVAGEWPLINNDPVPALEVPLNAAGTATPGTDADYSPSLSSSVVIDENQRTATADPIKANSDTDYGEDVETIVGEIVARSDFKRSDWLKKVDVLSPTLLLAAEQKTFEVDADGTIKATVTDSFGNRVANVQVSMIRRSAASTATNTIGDLVVKNSTATTDANGVATFNVKGKASGQVAYRFSVPVLFAKAADQTQAVTALVRLKQFDMIDVKSAADKIWNELKAVLDATQLGQTVQDLAKDAAKFLPGELTQNVGEYLRGLIANRINEIVAGQLHYDGHTIKDGHKPEHFTDRNLPDIHQSRSSLIVFGIGGSFTLAARTLYVDPEATYKTFMLYADFTITVDPSVFGFSGKIETSGKIEFGQQRLNASGGKVHP